MILEIADITVVPGTQEAFERAVQVGMTTLFPQARGFRGHQVRRSIESPERYVLLLEWETLEDHTVGFRESPTFALWRGLVAGYFARPPYVEHFELLGAAGTLARDEP